MKIQTTAQKTINEWGLDLKAIESLGTRLESFYSVYARYMRTQTRDTSGYGMQYMSGILRMDSKRNMANIGRQTETPEQNMQHFMSISPWSGQGLIGAIQQEVISNGAFAQGSMLLLDESGDEKAGEDSVGAGIQYSGRHGKVDMSQVGVYLTLANGPLCTWIDGEVFIPEKWFEPEAAAKRQKVGLPEDRQFQTKIELGWEMIQRAQARGLPFEAVACDTLYGRSPWLRDQCTEAHIECYSDVPVNTQVYLSKPQIGMPEAKQARHEQVLSPDPLRVDQVGSLPDTNWQRLVLRPSERGFLEGMFAARRVWTVRDNGHAVEEWLIIRQDPGRHTYTLSNAPAHTPLITLATRKSARYFAERGNQDAKEMGADEFQAIMFRAWEHHLALTILASWFIAETKIEWSTLYTRDPALYELYQVDILPSLSVANVRELLRAALPLPQLSPDQAAALVVKHLDNRTRSRQSRLRTRFRP
jgi:SRSO17 transposase